MVDTAPAPGSTSAPLPNRFVVPPVWSRITNLVVDRGEGSWLITRTATGTSTTAPGSVCRTPVMPTRGSRRGPAQAAKLLHGQQNIVYHEPGLRLYERLPH